MANSTLRHTPTACVPMGMLGTTGECFQATESSKHTTLTLEVYTVIPGKTWGSHILESREFLIDRGLRTLSVDSLASSKEHNFLPFCLVSITYSLKTLAWRLFLNSIYPDGVTVGKAAIHRKEKLTSKCPFHPIFSVEEVQCA